MEVNQNEMVPVSEVNDAPLADLESKQLDIINFLNNVSSFIEDDILLNSERTEDLIKTAQVLGEGYAEMLLDLDDSEKKKLFSAVDFLANENNEDLLLLALGIEIDKSMQNAYQTRHTIIEPNIRFVGKRIKKITEVIRLPYTPE